MTKETEQRDGRSCSKVCKNVLPVSNYYNSLPVSFCSIFMSVPGFPMSRSEGGSKTVDTSLSWEVAHLRKEIV